MAAEPRTKGLTQSEYNKLGMALIDAHLVAIYRRDPNADYLEAKFGTGDTETVTLYLGDGGARDVYMAILLAHKLDIRVRVLMHDYQPMSQLTLRLPSDWFDPMVQPVAGLRMLDFGSFVELLHRLEK